MTPGANAACADHSPGVSACEAYREAIELGVSRGRTARAIWQDLVSACSVASSYQSVLRFVRKLCTTQIPEARVVIVTPPGQEAHVDYGSDRWWAIPRATSTAHPAVRDNAGLQSQISSRAGLRKRTLVTVWTEV